MSPRRRRLLLLAAGLAAVMAAARFLGLGEILSLESLRAWAEPVGLWVREHPVRAAFLYLGAYIGVVSFSLPGAAVLSLAGGALFGFWRGLALIGTGAVAGAVALFVLVDRAGAFRASREKSGLMEPVCSALRKQGAGALLFMRLVPVFPFFLVNLAAPVCAISFRTFFWTTALGILPGSAAFAFAGTRLAALKEIRDVFSPPFLAALLLLGCLSLLPGVWKRLRSGRGKGEGP
jgi:uncharacterized membrane protein YdjX (TVP38/TMEM64 family)